MADFLQTDWPVALPWFRTVFSFLFPSFLPSIPPSISFSPSLRPFRHLVLHAEKVFHTGGTGDNPSWTVASLKMGETGTRTTGGEGINSRADFLIPLQLGRLIIPVAGWIGARLLYYVSRGIIERGWLVPRLTMAKAISLSIKNRLDSPSEILYRSHFIAIFHVDASVKGKKELKESILILIRFRRRS